MSLWGFGTKRWRTLAVGAGVALGVVVGLAASAAAKEPTREELEERVRRLEQIIRNAGLDQPAKARAVRKGTATAAPVAANQPPAPDKAEVEAIVDDKLKKQKVLAGWKDGFFLESANGDFKLKLRGYAQTDARAFPSDSGDTGTDTIYMRRVRPIFEGTVYKYFDFRIMPDFGDGKTVLQDAYGRVNYWPYAQMIAGKFKSPLSLERLQSGAELTFIERSIANNLAPNREIGVAFGGSALSDRVSYQLGVFNGSFDAASNDGDATSDKDVQARIFFEPWKGDGWEPLRGLGLGFAGTYGTAKNENISALNYKTAGRSNFFKFDTSSTTVVNFNGSRNRWAPQAYWYWGPFGFMGEYLFSDTGLTQVVTPKSGPIKEKDGSLKSNGWFAQASWVLTGEDASYKQVTPINNFDPANGRWGAFEVAARVSAVDIDNSVFSDGIASEKSATNGAVAYTAGLNWYFNRNFKVQLNYERTNFDNFIDYSGNERDHEDVFITRFQIAY